MYVVHDSGGNSGVMFVGNDGTHSGVFYKASDTSQPVFVQTGAILGAVQVDVNSDSADDVVVVIRDGNNLYWAYDGTTPLTNSIGAVSDDISNFCAVNGVGFYFSTWDSTNGARLGFDDLSGTNPTFSTITGWYTQTRISWITAVPGSSYEVMFSGDRCYDTTPAQTDGRQLWGASGGSNPSMIYDTSNAGQDPWWRVTAKINAAVGGSLYFSVFASGSPTTLWVSDGSTTQCIYAQATLTWGDTDMPFMAIAGMQGYMNGTTPYVYFYLDASTPSDLWVTDGSAVNPIEEGFDLQYCSGPKIPGQLVGNRPFVIVTDPNDPLYGTAYFTAGTYNQNGVCPYSLYKIEPGGTAVEPLWDNGPSGPAQDWLTVAETSVGGGVDNHKLYFKGGNVNPNERNRKLYVYDPAVPGVEYWQGTVTLDTLNSYNYAVSCLAYDSYADAGVGRLYYFSYTTSQMTNTNEKLCWWCA